MAEAHGVLTDTRADTSLVGEPRDTVHTPETGTGADGTVKMYLYRI